MDADLKELFIALLMSQADTSKAITALTVLIGKSHDELTASHLRLESAATRYIEASDARMKRLEENLDGLITAITQEHSNGKGGSK
jgi:hypothetical protein